MTSQATYFGANGWLLEIADCRVLVDPWLSGPLVFPPGAWMLRGELPHPWPVPDNLDLLLLTQGLADHCHQPSLKLLPRNIPVVGSPAAAKVVKRLGFEQIETLKPGETCTIQGLKIEATAGAAVPNVENGYLLDWSDGSLYLEPHGVLDPKLASRPVDTVITPIIDLGLPMAGDFITGASVLPDLMKRFTPRTVLASTTGGDVTFTGLISALLNAAEIKEQHDQSVVTPVPGEPIPLKTHA
jgi:L-ascorbate metabolism protein UlaG (beta-lactamase superfamily)